MKTPSMPFAKLLEFLRKNRVEVITALLLLLIVFISTKPTYIIMGLDNASPWFGAQYVLNLLLNRPNLLEYFGLLFALPLAVFQNIGIPSWVLSHIFVWGSFLLGTWNFWTFFSKSQKNDSTKFLILALLLGNLIPIWIFSQPIYLFVASYAGVSGLLLLLADKKFSYIALLYFFATIINPIAFIGYLVSVTFFVLLKDTTADRKWILKVVSIIFGIVFLLYQSILLVRPQKEFFFTDVKEYIQMQVESPLTPQVTEGLRSAELANNSFLNVVRFATGWGEQNTIDWQYTFAFRALYFKQAFGVILGLSTFFLLIYAFFKVPEFFSENQRLLQLYFLTIIVSSTYFLLFVDFIPGLRDAFRWISSKTWVLLYLPAIFLTISISNKLNSNKFNYLLTLLLAIYGFVWFSGKITTSSALAQIPTEYSQLSTLSKDDLLVVYPKPQVLFFRNYSWGYYGTDFISYLSKATVIDGTRIQLNDSPNYENFKNSGKNFYILRDPINAATDIACEETKIYSGKMLSLSQCKQ